MSRQPPVQQPPPVQRLRIRYAKRGRARFASHRDFGRAFERALRRAEIPMAFSSGFTPHPRISYINAAPTGAASEAEYLEIGLADVREPDQVRDALNEAMPTGLVIVEVVPASGPGLPERLTASRWRADLPAADAEAVASAIAELLAREEMMISRPTKNGERQVEIRAAIHELIATPTGFELVSAIGEPTVRPDDVVNALRLLQPSLSDSSALFSRIEQGTWDGTRIIDPLAA